MGFEFSALLFIIMESASIGWIAGILDGEGTVALNKTAGPWRTPMLSVPSTDIEILQELQHLIGGNITERSPRNPKYKKTWQWKLKGADRVIKVLAQALPYLHCPQKIYRARHIVEKYKLNSKRNGMYSDEEKAQKLKFEADFFAG